MMMLFVFLFALELLLYLYKKQLIFTDHQILTLQALISALKTAYFRTTHLLPEKTSKMLKCGN